MKRYLNIGIILTSIFIAVSGCSSKKTPVLLEKAGTMTEEQLKEELEGLSREEIVDVWGEAEGSLSGMYGEVFPLDEGRTLTLYYEGDGHTVWDVKLGEVSQTFEGTIEEIYGSSAVVAVDEGFPICDSGDRVSVMLNGDASMAQVGDRVRVSYSGAVMESYPLQLEKQNSIELFAREEFEKIGMENSQKEPYIVKTYEVTDPQLAFEDDELVTMVKYYEMSDGSWKTDDHTYQYRLEITGRMGAAKKDTTRKPSGR